MKEDRGIEAWLTQRAGESVRRGSDEESPRRLQLWPVGRGQQPDAAAPLATRDRYRVSIFGSARCTPGSFACEETKRTAAALTALGCEIVTGGGPA